MFSGSQCRERAKECKSNHCKNGGQCLSLGWEKDAEKFRCVCSSSYEGPRCETLRKLFTALVASWSLNNSINLFVIKKFLKSYWLKGRDFRVTLWNIRRKIRKKVSRKSFEHRIENFGYILQNTWTKTTYGPFSNEKNNFSFAFA